MHIGEPIICGFEYEAWGPHEGCKEFMDAPDAVWNCQTPPAWAVIYDSPEARHVTITYGPFTPEEIRNSEGHLPDGYTYIDFACDEHLPILVDEHNPFADNFATFYIAPEAS